MSLTDIWKSKHDKRGREQQRERTEELNEEKKCSCRYRNCKRHGKCEECITHHKKHPKHPLPACQRRKNTGQTESK